MESLKKFPPFVQLGASLGLGLIFMLGSLAFKETLAVRPEKPWVFACTFLIFFIVFNVVFSLNAENTEKYWVQSMISFVINLLGLGGLAYLVSGLSITEAGSFKWLFTVITISYIIFMGIVRTLKSIVEYAEKEEWNQPKLKKRKRK
jgi:peptidoglycan/LPS O-acetylase OafA/YrhL